MAHAIRKQSEGRVWTQVLDVGDESPSASSITTEVLAALEQMRLFGAHIEHVFLAAHSDAGAAVQDFAAEHAYVSGVILLGTTLTEQHLAEGFPTPVLTVGGDRDGVCRVSRLARANHHRQRAVEAGLVTGSAQPMIVLPGVSHGQFSGGYLPPALAALDLQAEQSDDTARAQIAQVAWGFMAAQMSHEATFDAEFAQHLASSTAFLQPLIDAMALEGSYHLKKPCSAEDAQPDNCWHGSPWTQWAQVFMGGRQGISMVVEDAFHPVWQVNPVHLPEIHNECREGDPSCKLLITTVSEAVYESDIDDEDNTAPISASEIRAKLMSRQSVHQAAGDLDADFEVTDGPPLCAAINERAWQWAREHADPRALETFERLGAPMHMGEDLGPYNMGPLWIWKPLRYERRDKDGSSDLTGTVVSSPTMKTPSDYFIPSAAGFHYCKLLSPARALEWIYVDALRAPQTP